MRNKSVAVLDVRSSEICAIVGEKGVNGTFVIKSKYSRKYDGYIHGELVDAKNFREAVYDVISNTLSVVGNSIKAFYVGVPGEFIDTVECEKIISFPSSRRITESTLTMLAQLAQPKAKGGYTYIKHSVMYYVLSDKRMVIDPVGADTDTLSGRFSFFYCKNDFVDELVKAFSNFKKIIDLNLIPSNLAQAKYLVSEELRDSYAVMLDLGYLSSTYSVICGNGIVFSESFSLGLAQIALMISTELEIPYDVADKFLSVVNLNAKETLSSMVDVVDKGLVYSCLQSRLRDMIKEGLDGICETIETCKQAYTGKDVSKKPVLLTGECAKTIRGTVEHLSSRLETQVKVIAPKLPFYDKPHYSSVFSLLSEALETIQ